MRKEIQNLGNVSVVLYWKNSRFNHLKFKISQNLDIDKTAFLKLPLEIEVVRTRM